MRARGERGCAEVQRGTVHTGEHVLQPPLLLGAEGHQTGQEETDEQPFAQDQTVVIVAVGFGNAEKQQEYADEYHGMVRKEDDAGEKEDVQRDQLRRDARAGPFGLDVQCAELVAKQPGCKACIDEGRNRRLPAEVPQHVPEIPVPA